MTDFDLRALVRQQVATTDEPDPAILWQRIVDAVPDEHLREALLQVGAGLVTAEVRQLRNDAITEQAAGRPNRWKQYGSVYRGLLASRVSTGEGWKFLADCTRDDLLYAAQSRRDHAAAVLATANFYEGLVGKLDTFGATTVGDLPPDAWGSAA